MALPSTSWGSKAWMPSRCRVGARFKRIGYSRTTSDRVSHTSGVSRSTIFFAPLMVVTRPFTSRRFVDEGLEQLKRHLFGQAALMEPEIRADDDDRTAGIVHALAQKVLAEAALLAL